MGWLIKYSLKIIFVSKQFPDREEAGTPNTLGAITLGSAIHVLDSIGMDNILKKDFSLLIIL